MPVDPPSKGHEEELPELGNHEAILGSERRGPGYLECIPPLYIKVGLAATDRILEQHALWNCPSTRSLSMVQGVEERRLSKSPLNETTRELIFLFWFWHTTWTATIRTTRPARVSST